MSIRTRAKPKRRQGPSRKTLARTADSLARQVVLLRDGRCMKCGSAGPLEWSHHVSRSYHATRNLPENACAHCSNCHWALTNRPLEHRRWIKQFLGTREFNRLERLAEASGIGMASTPFLTETVNKLRAMLDEMQDPRLNDAG